MLMTGKRYEEAEEQFRGAFELCRRLATADTSNVDVRLLMARSARRAGDAGEAMAESTRPGDGRPSWRSRCLTWFEKSLELYSRLEREGALTGNEVTAPAELSRQLAGLRNDI